MGSSASYSWANGLVVFGSLPRLLCSDISHFPVIKYAVGFLQRQQLQRQGQRQQRCRSTLTAAALGGRWNGDSDRLEGRCCPNGIVFSDDQNYGNKQVISVTPQLYNYLLSNVREPEVLRQLREETATMRGSQMQVSPDQAQLLAMLVRILGAERCIEVGVYTGYSSLAIALALPEAGCLVACERDATSLEVAKRYYKQAGVLHKVNVKHGLAADTLKSMILNGEICRYDFSFVDAEKRMYQEYFELLLQLVRVGGIIVFDNVLWHGKVADPLVDDSKTISIRNFNKNLLEDERVDISVVPIGDGMTICRKR